MQILKRAADYYEKNELRVDISFFLGGFLFDVFTLSSVDDLFSIVQQVLYLLLIGFILFAEFLVPRNIWQVPARLRKVWEYRSAIIHFFLGSLLSVYSLFFLKSASLFSSLAFVGFLMVIMVANELKNVQSKGVDLKIALYVICLFSFFSMLIPVILGFVGWVPFILSLVCTGLVLWGVFKLLLKKLPDLLTLQRQLLLPGALVLVLFFVFYLIGWIPPVPLAVEEMGIYHHIEKRQGTYLLHHENPWYKPWNHGDQDFTAQRGDKIHLFAKVFSPARFDDTVILHWQKFDVSRGWLTTDKIPMRVTGGRAGGYRGFASKGNYTEGSWRIKVETTDGREIGRIPFTVSLSENTSQRTFKIEEGL